MNTQTTPMVSPSPSGGWKAHIPYGLSLAFVCLFLYTAYHKAVGMDTFIRGIAAFPYVGSHASAIAWGVFTAETAVALLLIWPDTNHVGLWGTLGLMVVFTAYIGAMLLFAEALPCQCGGVIGKLSWPQHLLFNLGFTALAAGLLLHHYRINLKQLFSIMATISSKIKKAAIGMLAAAMTVGFSAFTSVQNQQWVFMGNSDTDVVDGSQYQLTGTPPTSCNSGEELPCILETPEHIDTQAELDAYISSNFGDDADAVKDAAQSRREAL